MTFSTLKAYAELLGATFVLRSFDGGGQLQMTYGRITYLASYTWGQERAFLWSATKWLHNLPWPTDDDPRVREEPIVKGEC